LNALIFGGQRRSKGFGLRAHPFEIARKPIQQHLAIHRYRLERVNSAPVTKKVGRRHPCYWRHG
jgi:hypothetical protein